MKRAIQMIVFLVTFTLIYTGLHYYTLGRIAHWIGISFTVPFIIALTVLILSFPCASIMEQRFTNKLSNAVYQGAAAWMGFLGLLLPIVILGELAVLFIPEQIVGYTALALGTIMSIIAFVLAQNIVIRRKTIPTKLKKNYVLAVITDAHLGPVHGKTYLKKLLKIVLPEKPDAVLLPGDLVDGPGILPDHLLEDLQAVSIPIFYSFGNHEEYVGEKEVMRVLQNTHVTCLRNACATYKELAIIGIDDSEDKKQLAKTLPNVKAEKGAYRILLYHRPDGLEDAAKHNIDLMLSGHTHRGQIFSFLPFVKMRFPRAYGWFRQGKTLAFTSSGAGTWGPPMRLGSRSEVLLITLKKSK